MTPEKQKLAASIYNALIRSLMAIITNQRKLFPDNAATNQQFKLLLISLAYSFMSEDGNGFIFQQPLSIKEIDNREVATRLILSNNNKPLIEFEEQDANEPSLIHLICSDDNGLIYTFTLKTLTNMDAKLDGESDDSADNDESGYLPSSTSSQTDESPQDTQEMNESFRDLLWTGIQQFIEKSPSITAQMLFEKLSDFSKKTEDHPILPAFKAGFSCEFFSLHGHNPLCLFAHPNLPLRLSKIFHKEGLQIAPECPNAQIKTVTELTNAMDQIHPGFR